MNREAAPVIPWCWLLVRAADPPAVHACLWCHDCHAGLSLSSLSSSFLLVVTEVMLLLSRVLAAPVLSHEEALTRQWRGAAPSAPWCSVLRGLGGCLGLLFLSGRVQVASAQGGPDSVPTTTQFAAATAKWRATMVRVVGPPIMAIDPKTHTVTIHLYNPQADTEYVKLALSFVVPRLVQPPRASALLSADSVSEDSVLREEARTNSLERLWSLVNWVQEPLPVELWMAPHQTVQLTFHVQVPPTLKPGDYSAHVIVETLEKQDATNDLSAMMNAMASGIGGQVNLKKGWLIYSNPLMPKAAVKLTYHVGATVQ